MGGTQSINSGQHQPQILSYHQAQLFCTSQDQNNALERLKQLFRKLSNMSDENSKEAVINCQQFHRLVFDGMINKNGFYKLQYRSTNSNEEQKFQVYDNKDEKFKLSEMIFMYFTHANTKNQMTFEDFIICYAVLTQNKQDLKSSLLFEIYYYLTQKVQSNSDLDNNFNSSDYEKRAIPVIGFIQFAERKFYIDCKEMKRQFETFGININSSINKEQFQEICINSQNFSVFTWIDIIANQFKGIENSWTQNQWILLQNSYIQVNNISDQQQNNFLNDFNKLEYQALNCFFEQQIINQVDTQIARQNLYNLFNIPHLNETLKQRIVDNFKQIDQTHEVIGSFKTITLIQQINEAISQNQNLNKSTFIQLFKRSLSYLDQFQKLKTILYNEFRITPSNPEDERQIIQHIMDGELSPTDYALKYMQKDETYYIINIKFWKKWLRQTAQKKQKRQEDQKQLEIKNSDLFEGSCFKLRTLKLDANIVVIPKRAMLALKNWYRCDDLIPRKVIQFHKSNQPKSIDDESEYQNPQIIRGDYINVLEIHELYLKFGQMQDNGEKPKMLYELNISRYLTLLDLKQIISQKQNISGLSKMRMWQKNSRLIENEELHNYIKEFPGMRNGIKIYSEVLLENQNWPSDNRQIRKIDNNRQTYKTTGCMNLGNTCYMNSIVQCLTNTPNFKEYFCQKMPYPQRNQDEILDYKKHINPTNPLAFEGNIQDAQEFLVNFLDSLHEELNIRIRKEYIENPSSNDRNEYELMIEYWSNFLRRNWSFVAFMFYGQLKSTMKCLQCNTQKISYDIYSTLSVPLPESSVVNLTITFYQLPCHIKMILKNRLNNENGTASEMQNNMDKPKFDRPLRLLLKMKQGQRIDEIQIYIKKLYPELAVMNEQYCFSELIITRFRKSDKQILEIFEKNRLILPNLESEDLYIFESLTQMGKYRISEFLRLTENQSCFNFVPSLQFYQQKLQISQDVIMKDISQENKGDQNGYQPNLIPQKTDSTSYAEYFQFQRKQQFQSLYETHKQLNGIKKPDEFIVCSNYHTTVEQLYEEVFMKVQYLMKPKEQNQEFNLWWRNSQNTSSINTIQYSPFVLKHVKGMLQGEQQLCSLCDWNQKCFGCILQPNQQSIGEFLLSHSFIAIDWNQEFFQDFVESEFIKPIVHQSIQNYNHRGSQDTSIYECIEMFAEQENFLKQDGINCEKCNSHTEHFRQIQLSRMPPILIIHLKRFKMKYNERTKINQFVKYPLLDLDLSKYVSIQEQYENGDQPPPLYDLFGVVNHFGAINSGHYISYVKNQSLKTWLQYDDSSVEDIQESRVCNPFAYILFYQRKDVQNSSLIEILPFINSYIPAKTLNKRNMFRGKPVVVKANKNIKNAYIWDFDEQNKDAPIHIKHSQGQDYRCKAKDLYTEDEIDDLTQLQKEYAENKKKDQNCFIF
eukprot:403331751